MPNPSDVFMLNCVLRYDGVQKRKNHHTPSVANLPIAKDQVCLYEKAFQILIDFSLCSVSLTVSLSSLSCSIYSSSTLLTCLLLLGVEYMKTQSPIHTKPKTPITINAISHPRNLARYGIVSGAISAPIDAPALNIDVA